MDLSIIILFRHVQKQAALVISIAFESEDYRLSQTLYKT